MKNILAATVNTEACGVLQSCFRSEYDVTVTGSARECLALFAAKHFEFLFIDTRLLLDICDDPVDANKYRKALVQFWLASPSVAIIILCSPDNIRKAVDAVKAGASNYLTYPLDSKEVRFIVDSTLEGVRAQSELDYFRDRFWDTDSLRIVSTNNQNVRSVFDRIRKVAPSDTTVLVTGETGTGKGLVAKLIHSHSPRKSKQFISIHCGAIPENLIESELFGHEKGAFTGAIKRKLGKFEIARGGTLFLDEIGTMPLSAQTKLLQVLHDKSFQKVGGESDIFTDVRIIAASNTDLETMAEKGLFRLDLFYRLNVFPIELPPLRERKEDIPMLADEFLFRLNKTHIKEIKGIHPDVIEAFGHYNWPGNIREMENLIERAYLLETSSILTPESFPSDIFLFSKKSSGNQPDVTMTLARVRAKSYEEIERNYLKELLAKSGGRIDATAKSAGISTRQLHKLLAKHGIRKEEFKTPKPAYNFRNKKFRNTATTEPVQ